MKDTRNPKWHRDELILTLNLYFDKTSLPHSPTNPRIIQLSENLNKLPIYQSEAKNLKFRNVNGVIMKLKNFAAIDPNVQNTGLKGHSKLDEKIFFEFRDKKDTLQEITTNIIAIISDNIVNQELQKIDSNDKFVFEETVEGEVLYKFHKYRERNKKIVESKKATVLKSKGRLQCEVCNFDFNEMYGDLGKNFIECHHKDPLSSFKTTKKTTLDDLALVCSNCHRMLHRHLSNLTIKDLQEKLNL